MCAWKNGWVNNSEAGEVPSRWLWRHRNDFFDIPHCCLPGIRANGWNESEENEWMGRHQPWNTSEKTYILYAIYQILCTWSYHIMNVYDMLIIIWLHETFIIAYHIVNFFIASSAYIHVRTQLCLTICGLRHCSDVIMSAMSSQIIGVLIVCSTVCFRRRSKNIPKLRVTCLCGGNAPMAVGFSSQRNSNAQNVPIWWRHHDILAHGILLKIIHLYFVMSNLCEKCYVGKLLSIGRIACRGYSYPGLQT